MATSMSRSDTVDSIEKENLGFGCDSIVAQEVSEPEGVGGLPLLAWLDALAARGLTGAEALKLLQAYFHHDVVRMEMLAEKRKSESVLDDRDVTSETTSRSSRRSLRRSEYLRSCEDIVHVEGFCYLRMVLTPMRIVVKNRLGSFPNLRSLLSISARDLDVQALDSLSFVMVRENVYHVSVVSLRGNALDVLRRTLSLVPDMGNEIRQVIGQDKSPGEVLSYDGIFGSQMSPSDLASPMAGNVRLSLGEDDVRVPYHVQIDMSLVRDFRALPGFDDSDWSKFRDIFLTEVTLGSAGFVEAHGHLGKINFTAGDKEPELARSELYGTIGYRSGFVRRVEFYKSDVFTLVRLKPGIYFYQSGFLFGSGDHSTYVLLRPVVPLYVWYEGDHDPGQSMVAYHFSIAENQLVELRAASSCFTREVVQRTTFLVHALVGLSRDFDKLDVNSYTVGGFRLQSLPGETYALLSSTRKFVDDPSQLRGGKCLLARRSNCFMALRLQ